MNYPDWNFACVFACKEMFNHFNNSEKKIFQLNAVSDLGLNAGF